MSIELTEAEKAFDAFIQTRREQGRRTYGQGLDHRDQRWNWERMALEELGDACQYLIAETKRLRDDLEVARALAGVEPEWVSEAHECRDEQLTRIGGWTCSVWPRVLSKSWMWALIDMSNEMVINGTQSTEDAAKAVVVALARVKVREETT